MGKKVRISNESVNCYGTRVLTSGVDLAQYQRNPVLLYMHERGTVVGLVKNVHAEGEDIVGEPVFDEATELSRTLKKQWDFGSLKMVSANFQVLETSKDEALLMEGQTRETVTRSRLFEVSIVDIGGNDDAIVLSWEGKNLSLASGGAACSAALPLLGEPNNKSHLNEKEMETKQIALMLGLADTATESEVTAKVESLKLAHDKVAALEAQVKNQEQKLAQMQLAAITQQVERAVQEKRIPSTKKDHFIELGKKVGTETLQGIFEAMQPQVKLSGILRRGDSGTMVMESEADFSKYEKLSAVPGSMMEDLHDNHHDEFVRLYKAEYGFDPQNN